MKRIFTLFTVMLIGIVSFAQLSGTKNIPGDYATLAAAITDLNTQGVAYGGVVINLIAGNPQTAPLGGYVIGGTGSLVLTTSRDLAQIVIQGNGNAITAFSPQTIGSISDAIFKIIGGDYITIQGFVMQENPANTTMTTAAANNMTEFGVAIFYATQTDGAKFNTIQNNTITLNRLYPNSFGIYSSVRHSPTVMTTAADITDVSGSNESLHIYGNTISNVNDGIVVIGSATGTRMNTGIDIGGTSLSTGNTISNYGKAAPLSAYVSLATNVIGIFMYSNLSSNVSWNSISSPGLNTATNMYGIQWQASGTSPLQSSTLNTVSHNSISVKSGFAASSLYGIRYDSYLGLHSFDISYNDFHDFGFVGVTGSAAVYCLYSGAGANLSTYTNNTFTNLVVNTSTDVYLIRESSFVSQTLSTKTVSNNSIVTGFSKSVGGGTVYGYWGGNDNSGVGSVAIANNNFSNITLTGATAFTGITGTTQAPVKSIHDNTVSNVTGGTSAIIGLTSDNGLTDIYSNNFANITGGGAITVMSCGGTSSTLQNVYSNTIHGISSTGASAIYGIRSLASGTAAESKIYKNNIYDISGSNASSILYGIYVSAGTTISTYNNMISDLRTPAANAAIPLAGIYVSGGTTNSVFFNTVYLNGTSTGALFGSAALYASTSTTLDMRNNILVNNSSPSGAGVTASFRRSNSTLTTYSANSDANDYYAGPTEDATHIVYYDGSAGYSILNFKALVSPRDPVSFRELPPFVNVAVTPDDLHLQTTLPTQCEGGGLQVNTPFVITDDFDGNTRSATPDVGADEFAGVAGGIVNPGAFTATAFSSQKINLSFVPNPSGNSVVIVFNLTGTFTTPSGAPPAPGGSLAGGTVLYNGFTSPYGHTGLTPGTIYYYKAFSYSGGGYSGGTTANATPFVAPPSALTATAMSSIQINLAYSLNALSNNVIIASNSSSVFGTPVNGTGYSSGNNLPGGGTVVYVGPLAAFNHTSLSPVTTYYYAVWSLDAFNYYSSTHATANATTFCTPITSLPWFEGFENMAATGTDILPSCWSHTNIDGSNYSCSETCNNNYAHSGSKFIGGGWNINVWDFTPGMQLTGGVSYDFSYWYKCTNTTPGYTVSLAYGTLPNAGSMTQVLYNEPGINLDSWTPKTLTFTPATSGIYFFGLHMVGPGLVLGIAFDDFSLQESSTCISPVNLVASGITTLSATLGWISGSNAWEYQVVPCGSNPGYTGIATSTNPVTVSGLNPGTNYDFYIRSNCSGTFGTWSGPITFRTLCSIYPAPFNEPFTSPAIPSCWTISGPQNWEFQHVNPSPWYGAAFVIDHTTGLTGNYAWVDGSSGSPGLTGITLLSPAIDVSTLTHPRVKFFIFNNNISSTLPADEQQLKVDLWDGATWHPGVFTWAFGQNAEGWQEKTISLSPYTIIGPIQIRFVVNKGSGNPGYDDLIIDDVMVEQTPDCLYPSNLTVTPGNVFANLDWTAGGPETAWDIEWGPTGFIQGTGTLINAVDYHPFTLTGLAPTTAYSYYVRANCGTSQSIWTGPKNFVTLVSCPAPEGLSAANLQAYSAELNWIETGTATTWHIEWGPDGFTQGTGTVIGGITSKPYILTGLVSGTNYAFYVRSSCGSGSASDWTGPFAFTTACVNISSFPWTEGFENLSTVGAKILPPCMTYQNLVGASGPTTSNFNTAWYGPHNGSKFIYTSPNNATWIFTPAMSLNKGVSYDFSFWMMNKAVTTPVNFMMDVAYGVSNTNAAMTNVLATNVVCGNSNYIQYKYTFTPAETGVYYLGIRTTSAVSISEAISLDDFRFEPTPACPLPSGLTVNAITYSNALIGWSDAATVQFDYGNAGHQPGTGILTPPVSSNPYTLAGLTPATTYDIYVRKDCGSGSYSPWFGPVTFKTLCSPTSAPFAEGFENISFPPDCWSNIAVTGSSTWTLNTAAGGYGSGYRSAMAGFYGLSAGRVFDLMTLPFDISGLTSPTLRFDYAYATMSGEIDEMDVYYSNDYGITYSLLLAMPGGISGKLNTGGMMVSAFTPDASQWGTQSLALPVGTNMIKFRATSAYGNNLYLDNVMVYTPVAHDVAATYIGINDVVPLGSVITPTAVVRNVGTNSENFTVTLTVGSYFSTRTITAMLPNSAATINFDPWTPATGNYTATLTTNLAGDLNVANNLISKQVKAMNLNKLVYGYVAAQNGSSDPVGPASFNLSTPGTLNSIANQSPMPNISGGTWANGNWYATVYDFPQALITFNTTTGSRTSVGIMPVTFNGLSYNPANNIMYGVAWDGSHSGLYSINMVNGYPTYIGACGSHVLINLAIDNSGQAYSVDINSDVLGTVNLSTGIFTPVGPIGFDANFAQDMEFDRETGNLFMAATSTSFSWLALVNKETGATMKIGNFEGNAEITGFAIPYIPALPLAVNGTVTNVTGCYGNSNGAIGISVSGGYTPLSYLWSNAATTASLSGVPAGTYSLTVTDAAFNTITGSWTVNQPPAVSLSAQVTNATCTGSDDGMITLTVSGGTPPFSYLWSNAATTQNLSGLAPDAYVVTITDGNGCLKTGSWTVDVTDPVCNNISVTGSVNNSVCFNAHVTITVANFTVEAPSGHVELIAGQSILIEPGTIVQSGGYLWGHISTTFCTNTTAPVVAAGKGEEPMLNLSLARFNLYPNPTSSNFTLIQKGEKSFGNVRIEIYNMNGRRVLTGMMTGEQKHEFSFTEIPAGLYFVKIIADDSIETIKLIKTR